MTLLGIVENLESFDGEDTIYAAEPWAVDSQALVTREPDTGGLPVEAQEQGLKYVLEVFIARGFLEGWAENLNAEPTSQEKCVRLIQYAVTDA